LTESSSQTSLLENELKAIAYNFTFFFEWLYTKVANQDENQKEISK
jgi:hypothetical protein